MKKRQLFEKIFSHKISWMHFHRRFQCLTTSATSSKSMPPEEILPLEIPWQPIATILNGYNYLEVYARTKGSGSEQALAMAKGIWAVLSEGSKEFVLKYPCHAPHKKRWFLARMTLMDIHGSQHAIVVHEAVSESNYKQLNFD